MAKKAAVKKEEKPVVVAPGLPGLAPVPAPMPVDPNAEMMKKVEQATKEINEYLEARGLELRVVHNVQVVPKQQLPNGLPTLPPQS